MAVTQNSFTGNGTKADYDFTFPYLKQDEIKASLDGTATTAFTLPTATKLQFNTAPGSGVKIKIFRETNTDSLAATFYAGSAIKSEDLNDNYTQNLYAVQEVTERYLSNLGGTMSGDLQLGEDVVLKFEGATDNAHETTLTVTDPTADRTITLPNVTGTVVTTGDTGTVARAMIAADAINGTKIADDAVDSEHIAADSLDTEHYAPNSVDSTALAADAVTGAQIADNAINSEHYTDGSIDTAHIADANVTLDKIENVTNTKIIVGNSSNRPTAVTVSGDVTIANTGAVTIADDAVTSAKIADNAVTTSHIADAELTELATMPSTTASALADLTQAEVQILDGATVTKDELNILDGVTANKDELNILDGVTADKDELNKTDGLLATTTELNTLDGVTANTSELNKLDGYTGSTTNLNIVAGKSFRASGDGALTTTSDTEIPSSKVVAAHVAAQIGTVGGFTTIATDAAFPATASQPTNGVIISISDAAGIVVNGSGVSTTGRTTDGTPATVTINSFPSSLNGETLASGVGLLVTSTGSNNTYTYHKLLAAESDVKQLSDDINDFNARYRIASSAPSSNNDEGDLYFDTAANKMKVYNGSAWDDVASVGSFYVNTLSSSSGTGGGSATFNGSAYRFTLSNAGTSAQQHIVSVNGVIQKPNAGTSQPSEGFALSGNDIIFSAAPASGSDFFIITSGSSVSIGTPSANSVNSSHIIDGSIVNGDVSSTANIAFSKLDTSSGATFTNDVTFESTTSGRVVQWDKSADTLKFGVGLGVELEDNSVIRFKNGLASQTSPPNEGLMFGDSGSENLKIYNDTTRSNIIGGVSGGVYISGTRVTLDGDVYTDDDIYIAGSDATKITWDKSADNLSFANDTKAIWGGTSELQIEHDGTTNKSLIQTTTSDPLLIKCAGDLNFVYTSGLSEATGATWDPGGAWSFSHGSSTKLATTSSGINVTGAITVNGTALSTAPEITANASGAVTAGKTMIINSNGTTSHVSATTTIRSEPLFTTTTDAAATSGNGHRWALAYDKDNNVLLMTWKNSSNDIYAKAGTPGTDTITWGSEVAVNSDSGSKGPDCCYVGNGKFIVVYRDASSPNRGRCRMVSVSSNTVSVVGLEYNLGNSTSGIGPYLACTYHTQQSRLYVISKNASNGRLRFTSCSVDNTDVDDWCSDWRSKTSGGSGTDGSGTYLRSDNDYTRLDLNDNNSEVGNTNCIYDPDSQRVHVIYCNDSENRMEVVSCDALTSTGVNTAQTIFSNNPQNYTISSCAYDTVTNRSVGMYKYNSDIQARTFTWNSSNTNFDFGTEVTVTAASDGGNFQVMGTDSGAVGFIWRGSGDDLKATIGTLNTSNGNISLSSVGALPGTGSDNNGSPIGVTYNPNQNLIYVVTKYSDAGNKFVESVAITQVNTDAEGYVGIANNSASDGNAVTIRTFGATNDNQSGLTVGSLYYIKKDGTLSTTADTPSVQAGVALSATKLLIKG